jgi:hypothetical protein
MSIFLYVERLSIILDLFLQEVNTSPNGSAFSLVKLEIHVILTISFLICIRVRGGILRVFLLKCVDLSAKCKDMAAVFGDARSGVSFVFLIDTSCNGVADANMEAICALRVGFGDGMIGPSVTLEGHSVGAVVGGGVGTHFGTFRRSAPNTTGVLVVEVGLTVMDEIVATFVVSVGVGRGCGVTSPMFLPVLRCFLADRKRWTSAFSSFVS